ncbi:MAG: TlpA family protein disulfide reductase [Euzebyales bacterium]|nr:TlpA family protein disulfide reductase [Euzebyales bacterium]
MTSTDREPRPGDGRRSSRRTLVVAVLAVLLLLGGVAVFAATSRKAPVPPAGGAVPGASEGTALADRPRPRERFPLPDATLGGFAGGAEVDLAEFRGTPLVINFWATWCVPCVKEMPAFAQVAREARGKVVFLGVNVQDSPANAEPFARRLGVDYPLAVDPKGAYYRQVRNFGMPTTLFVRPDGTVVYRQSGELDADGLRTLLRRQLGVRL